MRRLMTTVWLVLVLGAAAQAQRHPFTTNGTDNADWVRPHVPFRIIGNVYWVGGDDLSTYLITTSQGHILINTGVGETAAAIAASVRQLGFRIEDTRILTATHAHIDHAAGLAALKRMTGAKLVVNERDREVYETGGKADFLLGARPPYHYEPVVVDRTFAFGDTITLGDVTLTTHSAAGHTRGATTFTLDVQEAGRTWRVGIVNLPSINPGTVLSGMPGYPDIGTDYAATIRAQKTMALDVFLASHASQFRMHDKFRPGAAYDPNRFVDREGLGAAVQRLEQSYLAQVAAERARR